MPQRLLFWLLDVNYDVEGKIPVVKLWGLTEDGKRVLIKDYSFRPYFYVLPKNGTDLSKAIRDIKMMEDPAEPILSINQVDKRYYGKPVKVLKVTCLIPQSIPSYREKISKLDWVEEVLEADIRFYMRYLIDNGINPCDWHEVEVEEERGVSEIKVDAVYKALSRPKPYPKDEIPPLRILAFDIECYNKAGSPVPQRDPIIIISLVSDQGTKILTADDHEDSKIIKDFVDFIQSYLSLIHI